ncbi:ATP-dependent DNA ligase [Nocardioides terrisoli]|uniref:ATP-dependent DNA ligase n=1 Tax=Nocardioides terrisoli TaxID=3388267 RepID=UPI00287B9B68|nr:ATP-dependent DNA ligase [Nocardioides marmorisolisilvae]
MLLEELVSRSAEVAASRSRLAKRDLLAELLRRVPEPEIEIAAAYLSGSLVQRRTGVGWRSLGALPEPAATSTVHVADLDATLDRLSRLVGPGSATARRQELADLFGRLTRSEQEHVRALLTGNLRQGAQDAVVLEAVAHASGLPVSLVRRAAMFSGPTGPVARSALFGGAQALARFTLVVGRPVRPMLAGSAPDPAGAVGKVDGPFTVDTKLDGIRIQVHKGGDNVRVFSRSLDDLTDRLPAVVSAARALPAQTLILDGEAMLVDRSGRPRPFQETASSSASLDGTSEVQPFFFDLLLRDGRALLEQPLSERLEQLDAVVPAAASVTRATGTTVEQAATFLDAAVASGQEGVVVKRLDSPYAAGRRGSAWVKVKPRHTLDLVVLAVEWGSGRRRGLLSNIHLGARSEDGWVMLGKTFKGMSDEMLAWQTERFLALETHRDGHVVHLHPEQVVEIAFDGVQRSTRYPGGVALRFARVLRYRDDKTADEADTIESVRGLLVRG